MDELASSIRQRGMLSPSWCGLWPRVTASIRSSPASGGGGRPSAGLHAIPALVRDLNDLEVMEVALIENLQRSDLNALEEARGYAAMRTVSYTQRTYRR